MLRINKFITYLTKIKPSFLPQNGLSNLLHFKSQIFIIFLGIVFNNIKSNGHALEFSKLFFWFLTLGANAAHVSSKIYCHWKYKATILVALLKLKKDAEAVLGFKLKQIIIKRKFI